MTGILYGDVRGRGKEGEGRSGRGGKFTYQGGRPCGGPRLAGVGRVTSRTWVDGREGVGEDSKGDGRDVF
ncbi:hypothetical protein C1708_19880 [Streptomyces sp. DH-12]|nr:hypothetical protein C1708_19880 [Streptomyces sp. DH-12]